MSVAPADAGRRRFESPGAVDTERLGAAFARTFESLPQRASRLWLSGDLGAGKTTFARGLLRELGVTAAIRSPTYSLLEHYPLEAIEVIHVDLYRLDSPAALAALGLDEHDRPGVLWLIEWPEQGAGALPAPDLGLEFTVVVCGHRVEAQPCGAEGAAWLARVEAEIQRGSLAHDA